MCCLNVVFCKVRELRDPFFLLTLKTYVANMQMEKHPTPLSKSKGLNKTPYYHGALNSLHITLIGY